jgi:hypothetical protein
LRIGNPNFKWTSGKPLRQQIKQLRNYIARHSRLASEEGRAAEHNRQKRKRSKGSRKAKLESGIQWQPAEQPDA